MSEAKKVRVTLSLDDLDYIKKSDASYEFEYLTPDGEGTGVFISVLGGQAEVVTREVAALLNDRRRKEATRAMKARGGKKQQAEYDPIEEDIEFGQRMAAIRIVGWRGITDPFSRDNAMRLCATNREVAAQVIEHSDNMANFTKL